MLMSQPDLDPGVPGDQILHAPQVLQVTFMVGSEIARLHRMLPAPARDACVAGQQYRAVRASDQKGRAARRMARHADGKHRTVFEDIDDAFKLVLRVGLKM